MHRQELRLPLQDQCVMADFVLTGINHVQTIHLTPGLNQIGRNPTNNFRISDSTVSSFHCEITLRPDGTVMVKDLCSTNGTWIDAAHIDESPLRPGQVLRMGSVEFRLGEAEVRVAIPELKQAASPAIALPDGVMACRTHLTVAALFHCTHCNAFFCGQCVREIGREGGEIKRFCPTCRGQCVPVQGADAAPQKSSFFGRLTQTIRIRRN